MKKDVFIKPDSFITEALEKLNLTAEKTLIVVDNNKRLLGTLTDGDIRRFIIAKGSLEERIINIYNKNPIYLLIDDLNGIDRIKEIFLTKRIELIPIVNDEKQVVNYITWAEVFSRKEDFALIEKIDIPVVIMAGGKGTRLKPFTEVLPKPLMPLCGKTMLEIIMENFSKFGVKDFYLILNHKKELIKAYFNEIQNKKYNVYFIEEKEFLGTAGGLFLLKDILKTDFIVSNCDVIIKTNFSKILRYHTKYKADFTVVTAIKTYKIPYGIIRTSQNGAINKIEEKPKMTFQINAGLYFIKPSVLELIDPNMKLDMPELIDKSIRNNLNVIAYPISESEYIDLGEIRSYKENLIRLEFYNV